MTTPPGTHEPPCAATLVTGRTPVTRAIAQHLRDRGRHAETPELHGPFEAVRDGGIAHVVHVPDVACAVSPTGQAPVHAAALRSAVQALDAARLSRFPGRVVLLSSTGVYGDHAGPIRETTSPRPSTPAAVCSLAIEQLGARYRVAHGLDVIVLRLGELYGRALCLPAAISDVFAAAVTGTPLDLSMRCGETFHLIHVDDARRAVLAALDADVAGAGVFNVTDGETHSLCQVAERIRDCFPESRIETGAAHGSATAPAAIDIRAADEELGYRPRWGLARGIDDYAEWFSAQQRDGTAA